MGGACHLVFRLPLLRLSCPARRVEEKTFCQNGFSGCLKPSGKPFCDDCACLHGFGQRDAFNFVHPEIHAHAAFGKRADEAEHAVVEAADIQNIAAVLRLRGGLRLDV